MSKFKITLFLIVTVFFLNNCGFTPQYAGFKGLDFSLKINEINGDRDLNNAIRSQLDRYYINDPKLNTINVKIYNFSKMNASSFDNYKNYYTDKTKKLVENYCENDLKYFNYFF